LHNKWKIVRNGVPVYTISRLRLDSAMPQGGLRGRRRLRACPQILSSRSTEIPRNQDF